MPKEIYNNCEILKKNPAIAKTFLINKIKRMGEATQKMKTQILDKVRKSFSGCIFDKENNKKLCSDDSERKTLPLSSVSKKISKVANNLSSKHSSGRKPLQDVTNQQNFVNPPQQQHKDSDEKTPKPYNQIYLEDIFQPNTQQQQIQKKTQNHAVLTFINRQTLQKYQFSCFLEKELNIPDKFAHKTIAHSVDNDVSTDDDQIKSAIRNLHRAIETEIKESQKKIFA